MMWVSTPAYFAVVLLKTIWINGAYSEHDNHWMVPPTPIVSVQIEPSLDKCNQDGKKWELEATAAAVKGFPVMNGLWHCYVQATGGLDT